METVSESTPLRDPQGNHDRYRRYFGGERQRWESFDQRIKELEIESAVHLTGNKLAAEKETLRHQYAAGFSLPSIAEQAQERCRTLKQHADFMREHGGPLRKNVYPLRGTSRTDVAFTALALLLVQAAEPIAAFDALLAPGERSYWYDLAVKAFVPAHSIAGKYKADKEIAPWSDPIVRALALPPAERARALGAHMKNWPRLMRPYGWAPDLDTRHGKDPLFPDFAFEVALAVCGWDIDDSAFADHPYYPRDLVQYYRANVRHTRDAWRAEGAGAGVTIVPPPLPEKSDLAKSKRKGIARWVELVADGDQDATEAVLETIGKPRKIKDLDELLAALADAGLAIHADIKDDDSVAAQADALSGARGLGGFDGPAAPPAGPARCTALLLAWEGWLAPQGYRLAAIDAQDDAWHGVVVRDAFYGELEALSTELAIPLAAPSAVFAL